MDASVDLTNLVSPSEETQALPNLTYLEPDNDEPDILKFALLLYR
jgi:hypothetical protein